MTTEEQEIIRQEIRRVDSRIENEALLCLFEPYRSDKDRIKSGKTIMALQYLQTELKNLLEK